MIETPRLTLVTDEAWDEERVLAVVREVGRAYPGGDFAVQLRDKTRARSERAAWARRLRDATKDTGASFVVNGDVGLARDVGADGVHFGGAAGDDAMKEGEGLWRSVAAHSDEDVVRATRLGVNAVLVSPVFETPGKGTARGVAAIRRAVALSRGELDVIALGGVSMANAASCFAVGAAGVGVIRALLDAERPRDVAKALMGRMTLAR